MNEDVLRYHKQVIFPALGLTGQRRLGESRALIVGVGGLGTTVADLLARAGVGLLRLVDADTVELSNIHRQVLYDEADARQKLPKVQAAARRLGQINSRVAVEPIAERLDPNNIARLAAGMDLIVDGTDNFPTRFILNDFAVKTAVPWIFAGAVGAEGQVLSILPGRRPCLRCLYDAPPPPCADPTCRAAGVIGPAVAAIAALEAAEAIKILSGHRELASPYLVKIDLWQNTLQRIDAAAACRDSNCPCCQQNNFDFLEA